MIRLFRVFVPTSVVALLISEIVLAFLCFGLASYLIMPEGAELFLFYEGGFERIAIAVVSVILGLYFQDLYGELRIRSRTALMQTVLLVLGLAFLMQAALAYVSPSLIMPRLLMFTGTGMLLLIIPLWRVAFNVVFIEKGLGEQRLLFLGANPLAVEIVERLRHRPEYGLRPIGFLDDTEAPGAQIAGCRVLGSFGDVQRISAEHNVNQIVVALKDRRNRMPLYELLDLKFRGIHIQEAAAAYETAFGRVPIRELRPSQLIFSDLGPLSSSLQLQTVFSAIIAAIGLIVAGPIMILVAIAVKLTSPGPILFRQTRVGIHDRPFQVYKFRSMVTDAEAKTGAVWASKDDPRVTAIGKHLRRLRLDELPQLFNVLRGEMSIVGPRPERPEFVRTLSEQIPFYRQRHFVKPGITGWAQINHKYGDTIEDTIIKLEYDLYYIKNLSLSLDTYVIFHTVKVMTVSNLGQ